jgi:hypothetical protein
MAISYTAALHHLRAATRQGQRAELVELMGKPRRVRQPRPQPTDTETLPLPFLSIVSRGGGRGS